MATPPVTKQPQRPNITGTKHVVASGHYMSAQAALQILEAGGNAIDAGVAAGLATAVLEPIYVSLGGVAPIILFHADTQKIITISGLGTWPKAASCDYFHQHHGGAIPNGILRSVMPAAPDAWITALELYGTMSFADVAASAIRLAIDGFPIYPRMATFIKNAEKNYKQWPSSASIYLSRGRPPEVGELFVQSDVGHVLKYMADEETTHKKAGRSAGLAAARDAFYRGDVAAKIVSFYKDNGGLITADDLANFRVGIEPAVQTNFAGIDVYGCGPWCQGPMVQQLLNLVEGIDLKALGHNSAQYIHVLTEAIKLVGADRNAYYGDPRFVKVPIETLLSKAYAAERRRLIRSDKAWPDCPPAGDIPGDAPRWQGGDMLKTGGHRQSALDTSYISVADSKGNIFSATPSDGSSTAPVVPGLGFVVSPRGVSSWTDKNHPCSIAPGKRPHLTPNPALAFRGNKMRMAFGTPGGDVQVQAMLQVFINMFVFDMDPQTAIEAPRFASYGFPSAFEPHETQPARLDIEPSFGKDISDALEKLGHQIHRWPAPTYLAGSVCVALNDLEKGIKTAAADFRRTAYAVGW